MFFTVLAVGSNGGIVVTSENTRNSFGIISNPLGAFSDAFIVPITPMDECAFREDIFSRISSGQSPFFATIERSPFLSLTVAKLMFPWPLTVKTQPITVT